MCTAVPAAPKGVASIPSDRSSSACRTPRRPQPRKSTYPPSRPSRRWNPFEPPTARGMGGRQMRNLKEDVLDRHALGTGAERHNQNIRTKRAYMPSGGEHGH